MSTRVDVDGGAIAYYAVSTTSMTEEQLSWFVDNTVTKRLLSVPGRRAGAAQRRRDREIRVELDPARMQALGITAVEVNQQLRSSTSTRRAGARRWAAASKPSACWAARRRRSSSAIRRSSLPGGRIARLQRHRERPRRRRRDPLASRGSTAGRQRPSACSSPRAPPT